MTIKRLTILYTFIIVCICCSSCCIVRTHPKPTDERSELINTNAFNNWTGPVVVTNIGSTNIWNIESSNRIENIPAAE